jgi:HK97 gp10 family phage protein
VISAKATFVPRNDLGQFVEVRVTPAVRMGGDEVAERLEQRQKDLCPVRSGELRDSITTTVQQLPRTIRWSVGPNKEYAEYVEFGTGIRGEASPGAGDGPYNPAWPGMPAQPYVRPAYDEIGPLATSIFGTHLATELQK